MTDADLLSLQQAASKRAAEMWDVDEAADFEGGLKPTTDALVGAIEAAGDAFIRRDAERYFPEGYQAYLGTPHWHALREHMLKRAGGYCMKCHQRRGSLEVHHLTYRNLGRELESDLRVLCRECHQLEHT